MNDTTKVTRVAVLDLYNDAPNQGMRNIKEIITNKNHTLGVAMEYDIFNVRGKEEVPHIEDYDIFISSGGPGSPFEGEGKAWEEKYFHWLESLWHFNQNCESKNGKNLTTHKKHAFFICHSFQMICRFFNIGKVCLRKSVSFGVFPTHLTEEGTQDLIFEGLHDPFYMVDNRNWQVIEPDMAKLKSLGAEILALEKMRPHIDLERALMTIRFSPEIFATQFHPEADPIGMISYLKDETKKQEIIEIHGQEKYDEMVDRLDDEDKIVLTHRTILPNFLQNAIRQLNLEPVNV